MSNNNNLTFIESPNFPIALVNEASAKEKNGGGRPVYWEMVFWWTRKPLASTRAIIAGALLPYDFPKDDFIKILNLHVILDEHANKKTPHKLNPEIPKDVYEKYFKDKSLLDPFAGFGSIPIEALRLGLSKVVAVELLPTGYVFLKAVLEYPLMVARNDKWKKLVEDVKRYGGEIINELQSDPDIKELYESDVAVYIGTWDIKHEDHWTPVVGNWWLARVKGKKGWKTLAWMKRIKTDQGVRIEVVDAKKQFSRQLSSITTFIEGRKTVGVIINGERVYVGWDRLNGKPNKDAGKEKAICLHCGGEIIKKISIPESNEEVWYVKYALRTWNTLLKDYLEGKITLEDLKAKTLARPMLLAKVKIVNGELFFEEATDQDNEKLWLALQKLRQLWGDPDIPTEPIPAYESRSIWIYPYGFDRWFKLFNPRQLLTLVKLVKLIRENGKKVKEEKLKEGWKEDEACKYAEAVTTYLAISLCKYADYSSIISVWNPSLIPGHTITFRGLSVVWNWTESSPFASFTGTWKRNLENNISKGLSYLISAVSDNTTDLLSYIQQNKAVDKRVVAVIKDDATVLSELKDEKFDLIITDPPYYDDVRYSELSDFYYVWLKRTLSDFNKKNRSLAPKFHKEAFFDELENEIETQWITFARNEITLNEQRYKYFGLIRNSKNVDIESKKLYADMLARSFDTIASRLKDNGLLITYFAHSEADAWKALIYAGWKRAGFVVSTAYPLITESEENVIARGKAAITASIVVVWRKRTGEANRAILDLSRERDRIVNTLSQEFKQYMSMGILGITLYAMLYAKALSEITKYAKVIDGTKELTIDDIIPEASKLITKAIVKGANPEIVTPEAMFYLLFKLVGVKPKNGDRRRLPSSDLILVGYGTLDIDKAEIQGVIRSAKERVSEEEEETEGAEVAKREVFELLEPKDDSEDALLELLGLKGVESSKAETIKTSIDALHVLELYADRGREEVKKKYAELSQALGWKVKEAIELAKAIVYLETWKEDPEALRCERLLRQLEIEVSRR